MFQPVSFPDTVEDLVRRIEEMPPDRSVEQTVGLLRAGVSETALATAAALAACRSTELPFVHHGGPLHPVAALIAVRGTGPRLQPENRWLPLIQDIALVSRHIHDSGSGPYLMPAMEPQGAGDIPQTLAAFHGALRRHVPTAAEHAFLWLLANAPREVVLEALLRVAIANYRYDEHKLILAVNTIRLLDWIGWQHAPTLLRVAVRYNFMPSVWAERGSSDLMERRAQDAEALARPFESPPPKEATSEREAGKRRVGELREACAGASAEETPAVIAHALERGVSPVSAAEAVSLAACDLFLHADSSNPMGIHFMTGANAIRWVCRHVPALGPRALLTWALGPETRGIKEAPRLPLPTKPANPILLGQAVGAHDAQAAAAIALTIAQTGDGEDLLSLLASGACVDDASELHILKHHQAMAEEWADTRPEWAGVHLAAQAKQQALGGAQFTSTYQRARAAIDRATG